MGLALMVALGAAVGAPARFYANHWIREHGGTPTAGTLFVNVVGSFVLGILVSAGASQTLLAAVGVGFCGALTTFSTLALELWDALRDDRRTHAIANLTLSCVLGVGAAYLGWVIGS